MDQDQVSQEEGREHLSTEARGERKSCYGGLGRELCEWLGLVLIYYVYMCVLFVGICFYLFFLHFCFYIQSFKGARSV